MDRWQSQVVICSGGLDLISDSLTQGTNKPGSARKLQNYEPSINGGYSKILGYTKAESAALPGTGPILGVCVGLNGYLAARGEQVYYSNGNGWRAATSSARTGSITKYRFTEYTLNSTPVVTMCDGVNYAAKYDGTNYTLLNGTGAPTNPKYALCFLSRLALAGYSSNPRAITISAPSDDTTYSGGGAIEIVVGDIVVGLKTFREVPYIFCENSIYKITGSSSADFAIVPITKSIGCVSGDTIQEINGDLLFLAPDGLRSLAATTRIGDVDLASQSSLIHPIVNGFVGTYSADSFSSCVIRKKSQYRLFVYDSRTVTLASDATAQGILGKVTDNQGVTSYEWATLLGINAYCCDSKYSNNSEKAIFGHPYTGYVYLLESGNTFDGSPFEYIFKTPDITFSDRTIRKALKRITLMTEVTGVLGLSGVVSLDGGDATRLSPPTLFFSQTGNVSYYGTAVYGTSTYSVQLSPVFKKGLTGSGFTASFTLSGNDTSPTHRIDSYTIEFEPLARR